MRDAKQTSSKSAAERGILAGWSVSPPDDIEHAEGLILRWGTAFRIR